jgi:hypothetical protein
MPLRNYLYYCQFSSLKHSYDRVNKKYLRNLIAKISDKISTPGLLLFCKRIWALLTMFTNHSHVGVLAKSITAVKTILRPRFIIINESTRLATTNHNGQFENHLDDDFPSAKSMRFISTAGPCHLCLVFPQKTFLKITILQKAACNTYSKRP